MEKNFGGGIEKGGEKPKDRRIHPDDITTQIDVESREAAFDLFYDPVVVRAMKKAMEDPEMRTSSRVLIRNFLNIFDNLLEDDENGPDSEAKRNERIENIRGMAREILDANHAGEIEYINRFGSKGGKKDESLLADREFRYSLASEYGIGAASDYLAESRRKYGDTAVLRGDLKYCVKKIYGSVVNDFSLFELVSREIKLGPASRVGHEILKSLGIQTDQAEWSKSVNIQDMEDLRNHMGRYGGEQFRNICTIIFRDYPEEIKDFLAGDMTSILRVIKNIVEPEFKRAYEELTADAPGRKRERILHELVNKADWKFIFGLFSDYRLKHPEIDRFDKKNIFSGPKSRQESIWSNELVDRHGSPEKRKNAMEAILDKYGEGLVKRVGEGYEIADMEKFRELAREYYEPEFSKIFEIGFS
ncbi:MAG: hypothetical protein WC831_05890 [Parcubacteria group bacterium]|jgi:hypothetical protein